MKTLYQLLKQGTNIGNISTDIKLIINIQKTNHAGQRQYRHGQQNFISQQQIISVINKSAQIIVKQLIFNKLNIGQYFCLKSKQHKLILNIVGILQQKNDQYLKLIIITTMRKDDFKVKSGTLQITI